MQTKNISVIDTLIAGISLAVVVFYAPFAIAAILANKLQNIPIHFLIATAFFSMSIGTLVSALITRTGLLVAPGIGMASFVAASISESITVVNFLFATLIAGLIALAMSISRTDKCSYRQIFLDKVPPPIKVAIRGGIGILLASTAIETVNELHRECPRIHHIHGRPYDLTLIVCVILLVLAILGILFLDMWHEKLKKDIHKTNNASLIIPRIIQMLLPAILFIVLYLFGFFSLKIESAFYNVKNTLISYISTPLNLFDTSSLGIDYQFIVNVLIFSGIILFVFIIDIPGSPYDLLGYRTDDETREKRIDKSFIVTSLFSMLNVSFGLFTSVYYAENNILVRETVNNDLEQSPERESLVNRYVNTPYTAICCFAIFIVCGFIILFTQISAPKLHLWLKFSVSPILFCLGIHLTAASLKSDNKKEQKAEEHDECNSRNSKTSLDEDDHSNFSYFIPVSITLLIIHFIGFAIAVPVGICFYSLIRNKYANYSFLVPLVVSIALAASMLYHAAEYKDANHITQNSEQFSCKPIDSEPEKSITP